MLASELNKLDPYHLVAEAVVIDEVLHLRHGSCLRECRVEVPAALAEAWYDVEDDTCKLVRCQVTVVQPAVEEPAVVDAPVEEDAAAVAAAIVEAVDEALAEAPKSSRRKKKA